MLGADPGFADSTFRIAPGSAAAGRGLAVEEPLLDFFAKPFRTPRAIGAVEAEQVSGVNAGQRTLSGDLSMALSGSTLIVRNTGGTGRQLQISDLRGTLVWQGRINEEEAIDMSSWAPGLYLALWDQRVQIFVR